MSVVGFDVGNESCYIAAIKSGGIEILDNEYSLRSTPTYIAFTENSRDLGFSAKAKLITNLENTVFGFKRILGRKHGDSETENELAYLPYSMCDLSSGDIGVKVNYLRNNVVFSVEQLMAMILTKLKMTAEMKLSNKIRDCVLAVPVYYTDVQRRAMLDAVRIAGLNALKLINESTAIALAYGYFKHGLPEREYQNIVFVDIGNSSITVTACGFFKDGCKVLGCVWDNVGGRDFDSALVQYFASDFQDRYKIDVMTNKKALMALLLECESLKKMMSANSLEISFQIECFVQDQDVEGKIKREIFENLSVHILNRIERTLLQILSETKLNPPNIHSIELVGGSSRIPAVKSLVRKVFNQEPNSTLNQDEAVARGCALQCAILSPTLKTRDFVIEDIPSYTIKIVWKNKECDDEELEIFSKSDCVPSFKKITLHMSKPFTLVAFNVDSHSKICKIGKFTFGNLPRGTEYEFIKIQLKASLDIHAIFSLISAKIIIENKDIVQKDKICTKDEDLKDENMDLSCSQGEEKNSDADKPSSLIKTYDLTITSDVSDSERKLEELVKAEQEMISKDIEERKKSDVRNDLEEYIYDIKGKLVCELKEFLQDEDRNNLLHKLCETQDWLYDNETQSVEEYSEKWKEYQCLFDPIFKRFAEWEERPAVLHEFNETLQQSFDFINNVKNIEKCENISPEDIDSFYSVWQNSKQFRDQAVDSFSKMEKYHDAPVTVGDLKKSLMNLKNAFSDIERKINIAKETSLTCGDNHAQDPNKLQGSSKLEEGTKNGHLSHEE